MKSISSQVAALLRDKFGQSNVRLLLKFLAVLTFFFVVYTIIFHLIMGWEGRDYSWITGFYWTLTVMSTLGFGDITFATDLGRLFSITVLLTGIVFLLVMLPFTFIQFFYAPWLEAQNRARAPRALDKDIRNHVIFTQFDSVTVNVVDRLKQFGIPYVILIEDLHRALELHDMGFKVMVGDLDSPQTYERLNVQQAALVVVLNEDMKSTNILFTIRGLSDQVTTVTNADLDDSLDILQLAGSTHVFQFTKMLGKSLARRVAGHDMQANIVGRFDRLLIAEAPALHTGLKGKTLAESRLREITGVTVAGIWERGKLEIPHPDTIIDASNVLLLAGSAEQFERYDRLISSAGQHHLNQGPVLVLGGGRVGQSIADNFEERGIHYRVVEKRRDIVDKRSTFILGSAGDLEVLLKAGINDTPAVIITTHDDDLNIYLTIYCRRLRRDAQIISRASLDRNVETLHRAGADLVMSFTSLCTNTIINLLKPGQLLMLSEGLSIFRATVGPSFINKQLRENRIREKTGCSVIAVKRGEQLIINPEPSIILREHDDLVLIGVADAEKRFIHEFPHMVY
ncbi:potassium channel family protein [Desulfoferrobacter suflitae]|uniref:potassium channel family protein n=1 Tax=Desulfoferrobacter suflitae TaxID=2865782 RepID=UPI0021643FFE|nr:NAD-binding protein [Desulfoferrobacter suflitae]MCK8602867.1 NAD-binding protein [Desulfoferrobacter suflitae]